MPPLVSVIMPVFNASRYLPEALESLAGQTFQDFEVVVVDDGSSDNSYEILQNFSKINLRIFRQQNAGVGAALARACEEAQGVFLARMDADDRAMPTRLERQVAFLQKNPEVGLLGTAISRINDLGNPLGNLFFPKDHNFICKRLIARNLFCHPTVIMRADLVSRAGGYNPSRRVLDDYDLWLRMVGISKMANLDEILLEYRVHSASESSCYQRNLLWRGISARWHAIRAGSYPIHSIIHLLPPLLYWMLPKFGVAVMRRLIEAQTPSRVF